jgi:glyceraldehyde-3-phosphate dehydrogenase (NADP+)
VALFRYTTIRPFNYPLNEMYAMLIPALLMGNTVVMKLPNIGGLAHILSAPAFAAALPPGTVNFLTGSGRTTCVPVMASGRVDMLGFIGGSKAADALIDAHPAPHRLKVFSQLEGKNLGVVLRDADLDVAAAQCTQGATAYNGQRCTAIKLILVARRNPMALALA